MLSVATFRDGEPFLEVRGLRRKLGSFWLQSSILLKNCSTVAVDVTFFPYSASTLSLMMVSILYDANKLWQLLVSRDVDGPMAVVSSSALKPAVAGGLPRIEHTSMSSTQRLIHVRSLLNS